MAKKLAVLLLPFVLVVSLFGSSVLAHSSDPKPTSIFKDMNENSFGYHEVTSLQSRGFINGYLDGSFKPGNEISRAHVAVLLSRILKLETENVVDPEFKDVHASHPYYNQIAAVKKAGIFLGDTNGNFRPSETITRGAVAAVLVRAFDLEGEATTTFTDIASSGFQQEVETLFANGITHGKTATKFGINDHVLRVNFAVFLYRTLDALPKTNQVTLIHDTHFHGNFGNPAKAENIANYFGLINDIKAEKTNALMLGNGDDLASSILSSVFRGQHIIDAFNAGGLDLNTYGNHDFDMGPDVLIEMVEKSNFTWISANVVDKRTNEVFGKEVGAASFVIKNVNGVNIGFTGLINEEAPEITSMGDNAIVLNPAEAMTTIIPVMKAAGADIIVVLSHLSSPVAEQLANDVDGIDVIVGDHAGFSYEQPKLINNTILSFVGDEFKHLGVLDLFIDEEGKIADFSFNRLTLKDEVAKEGFQADENVKAIMDNYVSQLDSELNVVIGTSTVELDARKSVVRTQESALGNYIADAFKNYANADIGLIGGGGIRSDKVFEAGDITKKMAQEIMPFSNVVVKIEVTGQTVVDALENGVSQLENQSGRFLQVSGVTFSFDASQAIGSRVSNVLVGGQPIDLEANYTIALPNFTANGGDGFSMFESAPRLLDEGAGPIDVNVLIDTIKKDQTISPVIEGRITEIK